MTAPKKKPKVSPTVERAVDKLLKEVMKQADATLLDKLRVLDRAIKIEAIKAKVQDDEDGEFFRNQPQDDETDSSDDERADDDGHE